MNKMEIASYLASLSSLLKDQDTSGVHMRSQMLGDEFNKHWDLLKETIQKENEDEARNDDEVSSETRFDLSSSESESSFTNRRQGWGKPRE